MKKRARHLAFLAACWSSGDARAAGLSQLSDDVAESAAGDADLEDWESSERKRLMVLLAEDTRPKVRLALTQHIERCPLPLRDDDFEWICRLAQDDNPDVRQNIVRGLARLFQRTNSFDALYIAANLAAADDPRQRECIATVLSTAEKNQIPCADMMIKALRNDVSLAVRHACLPSL